ncbi:MAG: GspH/FimT family pseudopilin [Candidatus Thiodiazotropha sp. (ex Semelilucina semeliformis)]|nr:GspH/FimT family pseudopilin [Candidatus Thiodiazotropha sp. (ex Semelilucina semeliformis)]
MKKISGMTLIELMVTLAVGILILSIGVPSFMSMMSSNQAAGYSNDLVSALRLARSEAVKRSIVVSVCSRNKTPGSVACDPGAGWAYGWLVFTDDGTSPSNGDFDSGSETLLRSWEIPENDGDRITFSGGTPGNIGFIATGANTQDADIQFSFKKTDCHGMQARQITVSRMGRASFDNVSCL